MGKTFSIADAFQNVPNPGTDREQITYISADLLVSDEQNFYSMDNLDELAGNIQLVGLQQPIRVRPDGAGKYIIISGHRRRAAIERLRKEEPERWAEIPCIIEDKQESDAMRELRLILANCDTRKMTAADLDRQAQRIDVLLRQLKEEGVNLPGRTRDYVAEMLQTSKSKLSRLKVIREGLITPYFVAWDHGDITESVAYRIARESPDVQKKLNDRTSGMIRDMSLEQVEGVLYDITHKDIDFKTLDKAIAAADSSDLPGMADHLEYLAQRESEDASFLAILSKCTDPFVFGLYDAGKNKNERVDWLKKRFKFSGFGNSDYDWIADSKGLRVSAKDRVYINRTWSEVYDTLCTIALRELDRQLRQPIGQTMIAGWMPGGTNPGHSCQCVVDFTIDGEGEPIRSLVNWNAQLGQFVFCRGGLPIEAEPIRWMELPEVE